MRDTDKIKETIDQAREWIEIVQSDPGLSVSMVPAVYQTGIQIRRSLVEAYRILDGGTGITQSLKALAKLRQQGLDGIKYASYDSRVTAEHREQRNKAIVAFNATYHQLVEELKGTPDKQGENRSEQDAEHREGTDTVARTHGTQDTDDPTSPAPDADTPQTQTIDIDIQTVEVVENAPADETLSAEKLGLSDRQTQKARKAVREASNDLTASIDLTGEEKDRALARVAGGLAVAHLILSHHRSS